MAYTFNGRLSMAWRKSGLGSKDRPGELFPQFTQKQFDQLKQEYNEKYGYTIRIPQFDDIVHWKPPAFKTEEEKKAEKKANLIRVLESPQTDWARDYSTVMTQIDNIQDTSSVLIFLANIAWRTAPKAFGKLLPIIGWLSVGYDLLNIANEIGRAPLTGMGGKRSLCKMVKTNPFSKKAQYGRIDKIKNWKPNLADFLQIAQVTDQYLGVGLSLGGIMGAITSLPFGAYHYLKGDPVRFAFDAPEIDNLQKLGAKAQIAATLISSQGQVFDELTHFYTYVTAALGTMATAGFFKENDLASMVEDPMNIALPADRPTDPLTIATIREAGLDVDAGVGWPFNGQKEISLGDLLDATHEPIRSNFFDYATRHNKDWYGWVAAWAMDYIAPHTIGAIDPTAEYKVDDTPEMKVLWKMIKAPLLPDQNPTPEQQTQFYDWIIGHKDLYGKEPGILEIEQKLNMMGIKTKTTYGKGGPPSPDDWWPPGWTGDES